MKLSRDNSMPTFSLIVFISAAFKIFGTAIAVSGPVAFGVRQDTDLFDIEPISKHENARNHLRSQRLMKQYPPNTIIPDDINEELFNTENGDEDKKISHIDRLLAANATNSNEEEHIDDMFYHGKKARIVGGDEVEEGGYPFLVSIFKKYSETSIYQLCGGALIAPNIVLSAAHCAYKVNSVQIGRHNLKDGTAGHESFNIIETITHPGYVKKTYENDFAIFVLDGESKYETIEMNRDANTPQIAAALRVIGWGMLSTDGTKSSTVPREAAVSYVDQTNCRKMYRREKFTDNMMCASDPGRDACQGDSGGPLVLTKGDKHVLVGVVSWGYGCADPDHPGVYARISHEFDWIDKVTCEKALRRWDKAPPSCNITKGPYLRGRTPSAMPSKITSAEPSNTPSLVPSAEPTHLPSERQPSSLSETYVNPADTVPHLKEESLFPVLDETNNNMNALPTNSPSASALPVSHSTSPTGEYESVSTAIDSSREESFLSNVRSSFAEGITVAGKNVATYFGLSAFFLSGVFVAICISRKRKSDS